MGRCLSLVVLAGFAVLELSCSTKQSGLNNLDGSGEEEMDASSITDAAAPVTTKDSGGAGKDVAAAQDSSSSTDTGRVADAPKANDGKSVDSPVVVDPPDAPIAKDAPVASPDLGADRPPTNQPTGAACGKAGECRSGFCVDGVCCGNACEGACNACSKARTGLLDGVCGAARDVESKPCGTYCGIADPGVPAVLQKVCTAGQCLPAPTKQVVDLCGPSATDPCIVSFCINDNPRCQTTLCEVGDCCCKSASGRACMKQEQCKGGERMCVQ